MAIQFNLSNEELVAVIRANRVVIHNPPKGKQTVSFRNERVIYEDNKPVATTKLPSTNRHIEDVVTETTTIVDPVTGETITVSVAGMSRLVEEFFMKWYIDDNPDAQ